MHIPNTELWRANGLLLKRIRIQRVHTLKQVAEAIGWLPENAGKTGLSALEVLGEGKRSSGGWLPAEYIPEFARYCGVRPSAVALLQELGRAQRAILDGVDPDTEAWRAAQRVVQELVEDAASLNGVPGVYLADELLSKGRLPNELVDQYCKAVLQSSLFASWCPLDANQALSGYSEYVRSIPLPPLVRLDEEVGGYSEVNLDSSTGAGVIDPVVIVHDLCHGGFRHSGALWLMKLLLIPSTRASADNGGSGGIAASTIIRPTGASRTRLRVPTYLPVLMRPEDFDVPVDALSLATTVVNRLHGAPAYAKEFTLLLERALQPWFTKALPKEPTQKEWKDWLDRFPLFIIVDMTTIESIPTGFRERMRFFCSSCGFSRMVVLAGASPVAEELREMIPDARTFGVGPLRSIVVNRFPAVPQGRPPRLRRADQVVKLQPSKPVREPAVGRDANGSFRLLVEGSGTGSALAKLVASERSQSSRSALQGLQVEVVTASYQFICKYLTARLQDRSKEILQFDAVVVPHVSLFHAIRSQCFPLRFDAAPDLPEFMQQEIPEFLPLLRDESESADGNPNDLYGLPFHAPTKVFAYSKRHFPDGFPNSYAALVRALREASRQSDGLVIQGLPSPGQLGETPELYYEYIAWCHLFGATECVPAGADSDSVHLTISSDRMQEATVKFLTLCKGEYSSASARGLDWYSVVERLAQPSGTGGVALCLPFTDTLIEIITAAEAYSSSPSALMESTDADASTDDVGAGKRRSHPQEPIGFAPLWLRDTKDSSGGSAAAFHEEGTLLGSSFVTPHPFTLHVIAALRDEAAPRLVRFMSWFYGRDTQREFSRRTLEAPLSTQARAEILGSKHDGSMRGQALRAACLAHEYLAPQWSRSLAFFQTGSDFPESGLNAAQEVIRKEIKSLVSYVLAESPGQAQLSEKVRAALTEAEDELRKRLLRPAVPTTQRKSRRSK
jgi:hypothetical protein